jgi:hypothetical protein
MDKLVLGLQYHDRQGLAKYPVDESQLTEARAIVKSYEPTAYFNRRLVIPEIELRDWWIAMPVAKPTASRP